MYIANSRTITIRFFKRSIIDMLRKRKRNYIKHSNKTTEGRKRMEEKKKKISGQLTEIVANILAVNPAILISTINMNYVMHILRLSE